MAIPERELTEDGYEAHFATNHLGPFVFTTTILPSLRRASSPRIVNVSSWGHHLSPVLAIFGQLALGDRHDACVVDEDVDRDAPRFDLFSGLYNDHTPLAASRFLSTYCQCLLLGPSPVSGAV
jgi:NAD(P)-dependent dehydrogenase (short-subunit alcohol dehydrogenase family)